nr:hypothetical protein [Tanacetum cinerariifolium]
MLSEIHTYHIHQPQRTFAAVINRCISGKSIGLDRLRPSRAQILWGMFYKKNVNFVGLLWEDFQFQADNREISFARKENMTYPRFNKVIINHFISKDKTISMRNQKLTTILEEELAKKPKRAKKPEPAKQAKTTKKTALAKKSSTMQTAGVVIKDSPGVSVLKKKAQAKLDRDTHMLYASSSSDGVGSHPKVPNELKGKTIVQIKELVLYQGFLMCLKINLRVKTSLRESGDDNDSNDDDNNDDNDDDDDEYVHTPNHYVPTEDEKNDELDEVTEEEYERINEELYGDLNVSLTDVELADKEKDTEEMTVAGYVNINQEGVGNQVKDDAQATQKTEGPILSSFISSDYAAKYLNFDSISPVNTEVVSMLDINVQHEVPRTTPLLTIPLSVIPEHIVFNPPEIVITAITNLDKDVKELKTVNYSATLFSTLKSKVPNAIKEYLGTSLDDAFYKVLKKHDDDIIKEHSILAEIVERLRQQYVPEKSTKDIRKIKMEHARKQQEPKELSLHLILPHLKNLIKNYLVKSTETSKGTSKSQPKSTVKSAQAEETVFEAGDTQEPQNQGQDMGNTDDQPNVKEALKHDWFKKPKRPPTPDSDWDVRKSIDFRPPQT